MDQKPSPPRTRLCVQRPEQLSRAVTANPPHCTAMPADPNQTIDRELVADVINATLQTMLQHLSNPPSSGIKASYLETVRKFLSDHGLFLDLLNPDKAKDAAEDTGSLVARLQKLTEEEAEEEAAMQQGHFD